MLDPWFEIIVIVYMIITIKKSLLLFGSMFGLFAFEIDSQN